MKKESVESPAKYKAYIIDPSVNHTRTDKLIKKLLMHGIEIEKANEAFIVDDVENYRDHKSRRKSFAAGTYIINVSQPLRPLVNAILEFDPRMNNEYVKWERESLEKGEGTKLYEVSAWSMLMAYGLDAYRTSDLPGVKTVSVKTVKDVPGKLINPNPAYGYLFSYNDDAAVGALLKLLDLDYKIRIARKPFTIENESYDRGTILIRLHENPNLVPEVIKSIAESSGITIRGVNTALCQEGSDLGTGEYVLITPPRIAMLTGPSISMGSFGSLWYLIDRELGMRFSIINYAQFGRTDLRKYNVLILPSAWGSASYKNVFDEGNLKKLKDWISDGGTLVAIEGAAAFIADSSTGLSSVKLKRQALKDLALYKEAFEKEQLLSSITVDSLKLWEDNQPEAVQTTSETGKENNLPNLVEEDQKARIFYPNGVILKLNLNKEHWLNFGAGENVPAIYYSSYAYLSKIPVQTAGRFSNYVQL